LAYPDGTIFFCEGEKDADNVAALGHCATTVAGGKWTDNCVRALTGRDILILQDNDEAGRKKALATAQALHGTAATIRIVRLPGLPEKGDVSDWLDAHPRNADRLVDICFDQPLWTPNTAVDNKQTSTPTAGTPPKNGEIILRRAADMEAQPIDWIWNGRIARGKLTLIAGDPGLGKSQIGIDLHARLSTGAGWPDGEHAPVANGIILSAEDSTGDTLRPRLEAAGADLKKVWILDAVRTKDGKRSFTLQEDLQQLGNKVAEIGDVAMITIDPITSYMGKIDSHRTTDVRAVLEPLAAFAEQYNVAILAVSHPPKAVQAKAIHAVSGSLAFVAAARMVFIVVEEPETGRRLMLPTKNNLAPLPAGLAYRLEQLLVSKNILASHVVWDREPVTVNANQALAEDRENARGDDALREAKDFIREALAAGPKPAKDVEEQASAAEIAPRTLRRARKVLKVQAAKDGFAGPWTWSLP
jgi:putative DNA primase/helicase